MMPEPIEQALHLAGVLLVFETTEILAIPVFEFQVLYKGEDSPYEIERQNFSFLVSTATVFDESIQDGNVFTMDDSVYNYSFTVERLVPDMTGWTEMYCIFTGKESV